MLWNMIVVRLIDGCLLYNSSRVIVYKIPIYVAIFKIISRITSQS